MILCDLMMPQMTGMELHDEVARIDAEIRPRAWCSSRGGAFTPRAREFLERCRNQRIEKPFDVNGLRALINGLVQEPVRGR